MDKQETERNVKIVQELEARDYIVQRGHMQELDTLKLASEGKLISCFGNNAGSTYIVSFLPPAPGQAPAKGVPGRGWPDEEEGVTPADEAVWPANPYFSPAGWTWKLRPDEAIVVLGTTPPPCVYFSLIGYVLLGATDPEHDYASSKGFFNIPGPREVGDYHPIFGSIGMPLSQHRIATDKTPHEEGWELDLPVKRDVEEPFGALFAWVVSGDLDTAHEVSDVLAAAGISRAIQNFLPLPAESLSMGLQKGADTFCTLGRISQPKDRDALRSWLDSLPHDMLVLRITPKGVHRHPAPAEAVVTRGCGIHEADAIPQVRQTLDALRSALIAEFGSGYTYEEPGIDIAVPEGRCAYLCDRNSQGDNHDTTYLMSGDFVLEDEEDVVVVYGVNHTKTGKACYTNAVLYARPMLNGVASVYDKMFEGSARELLPKDTPGRDAFYVCRMARPAMAERMEGAVPIPYSTGNADGAYFGVDDGHPVLAAFRAYIEPATGVGASYYEIVWDRLIVFHRRRA